LSTSSRSGRAGGAAASGGMAFQAAVTAIAMTAVARGMRLNWLPDVDDTPAEVASETHGAGDDVRLRLATGEIVEVQCKKGLGRSIYLWDSLLALAEAIHADAIQWGLLVVCPQSSGTVRALGPEIRRLADGRRDDLSEIAQDFVARLEARHLPVIDVCAKLAVEVVAAIDGDRADIRAATVRLEPLLERSADAQLAWRALETDANALIRRRGARAPAAIARVLEDAGVTLADSAKAGPAVVAGKLARWTESVNAKFRIIGVKRPLPTVEALDLDCHLLEEGGPDPEDLKTAFDRYRSHDGRSRNAKSVDPTTLGRFYRHAVALAGPGMGKSTLVRRLALDYAADGYPVVRVALRDVAQRMRRGEAFLDSVFQIGLSGSGLNPLDVRPMFADWVLLGDGLDECGEMQATVAEGLLGFQAAFPQGRAIVTSRPIGYQPPPLSEWRHYEFTPFQGYSAWSPLARLLATILDEDDPRRPDVFEIAHRELTTDQTKNLGAPSPFVLSLAASLVARGVPLSGSKAELYERLLTLIEQEPPARAVRPQDGQAIRRRVLELLGWVSLQDILQSRDTALSAVADILAAELGVTPLAARDVAERCVAHWEELGLVETLRHSETELLVFVHKTFGEYLAAKYIADLPVELRDTALRTRLDRADWSEVLDFTSAMIGAGSLVRLLLVGDRPSVGRVARALDLAADHPQLFPDLVERLLDAAYVHLDHRDRSVGIKVAGPLARAYAAVRSPPPPPAHLRNSPKLWTQLAAWCCMVQAGPETYRLSELEDLLRQVPDMDLRGGTSRRGFVLELGVRGEIHLAERLILLAVPELLAKCEVGEIQTILRPLLAMKSFWGTDESREVNALLAEAGAPDDLRIERSGPTMREFFPPEYRAASRMAYLKLASVFAVADDEVPADELEHVRTPLDLAAFLQLSKLDTPGREAYVWENLDPSPAVTHVLLAVLALTPVDQGKVCRQARVQMRLTEADTGPYSGFPWLARVDAPEIAWSRATTLTLDANLLSEVMLHHPAETVARLAAHLIQSGLPQTDQRRIGADALEVGRGVVAAYGAVLLEPIDPDATRALIHGRLTGKGHHHGFLYKRLVELPEPDDIALDAILRYGLFADHDTAIHAADVAEHFAKKGRRLLPLLLDAWRCWQEIEVNWKGNSWPARSPREALLKAIEALDGIETDWLVEAALETRRNVENARTLLWPRLRRAPDKFTSLIERVLRGELKPLFLRMAIQEKLPFAARHLDILAEYIDDTSEDRREIAGLLAQYGHLDEARTGAIAAMLCNDEAEHLRHLGRNIRTQLAEAPSA